MACIYAIAARFARAEFARGYACGRQRGISFADLAASINELQQEIKTMIPQQINGAQYGKASVFYVPCGQCGNVMNVVSNNLTVAVLECGACGHECETDRLPFLDSKFFTLEAEHFQQLRHEAQNE